MTWVFKLENSRKCLNPPVADLNKLSLLKQVTPSDTSMAPSLRRVAGAGSGDGQEEEATTVVTGTVSVLSTARKKGIIR
jgi:hypothetical protein